MLIGNEPVDLRLTLIDSAQCFRWSFEAGWYGAAFEEGPVWLRQSSEGIEARGQFDPAWLRRYLDLDRDYAAVAREFADIPQARRAVELYPGLRVMNQPAWEALISFILSANNNVSRIRGLVAALSRQYGRRWEDADGVLFAFPTPSDLAGASEAQLRGLGVGYRAPYLIETARRVAEGFPLEALRDLPYAEAHARLVELPGVGDKVADCVQLFGCGHACAFPVDVWVARLLADWFGMEGLSRSAMARQARQRLGEHAGLMQQFLFHAARMGDIQLGSDEPVSPSASPAL